MSDLVISFLVFISMVIPIGLLAAYVDYKTTNSHKETNNSHKETNNFDTSRQVANIKIMQILLDYVAKHPSQRFGQILRNTGVLQDVGVRDSSRAEWETPDYYIDRVLIHEEPQVILERMKKVLADQQ